MKAEDIYRKMKEITRDYYVYTDQMVAIAKWIEAEFVYNPNKSIASNNVNGLCGSFEPDNKTSSASKCKCGREEWEHPKKQ